MDIRTISETSTKRTVEAPVVTQPVDMLAQIALVFPYLALALVFLWFGGMKFTAYEAEAIAGLVANSPLLAWTYSIFSERVLSALIGLVEVSIATLLILRFWMPKASMIGAAGAVVTFVLTASFFLSTPNVFLPDQSGPAISVMPGQFLLKDIALLALSVWLLHESRTATAH